jgi:hypothetical protein
MTQIKEALEKDAPVVRKTNKLLIVKAGSEVSAPLKLKPCIFPECEAFCCYDGVYLSEGEEEMIKAVATNWPENFRHLPEEYVVDGNWYDRIKGRKTAVRPFTYKSPDYPKHFDHTRCVFAYEDGRCSLQTAAQKQGLHPWRFKPAACWLFPLKYLGERVILPPYGKEKDPDYIDEGYPGFVTFLPCGRHSEDGLPWYQVLEKEILYFLNMVL